VHQSTRKSNLRITKIRGKGQRDSRARTRLVD